jgi:hypothetical protein
MKVVLSNWIILLVVDHHHHKSLHLRSSFQTRIGMTRNERKRNGKASRNKRLISINKLTKTPII